MKNLLIFLVPFIFGCNRVSKTEEKIILLVEKNTKYQLRLVENCHYHIETTIAMEGIESAEYELDMSKLKYVYKEENNICLEFKVKQRVVAINWWPDITDIDKRILPKNTNEFCIQTKNTQTSDALYALFYRNAQACGANLKK